MSSATPGHARKELARYHRRRAAGLCVGCGKVPPEEDRVRCRPCAARQRRAQVSPSRRNGSLNFVPEPGGIE